MRLLFISLLFLCFYSGKTQILFETILNSTGGSATPSLIHLEWNVGEMTSIDLYNGSNTIITAGLLQGNAPAATSVLYTNLPANAVALYPNPVSKTLIGNFHFSSSGDAYVRLVNLKGQILNQWKFQVQQGMIQRQFILDGLAAGTYFTEIIFIPSVGIMQKASYKILKL